MIGCICTSVDVKGSVDMYRCAEVCLYLGISAQVYVCMFDWVCEGYISQCTHVPMCVGRTVECVGCVSVFECICPGVWVYICVCIWSADGCVVVCLYPGVSAQV